MQKFSDRINNMVETVTLQIPEALYQRLAIASQATRAIAKLIRIFA